MDGRLKLIADHFGLDNQLLKTQEELAELIQAIAKLNTKEAKDVIEARLFIDQVAEEIADVEILFAQLKCLFGCSLEYEINLAKERKIERTLKRYKIRADK